MNLHTTISIALRIIVLLCFVFVAIRMWQEVKKGGSKYDKRNTVNDVGALPINPSPRVRTLDNVERLFK